MNKLFFALCISLVALTAYQCNNRIAAVNGVLKGKLVIKEICSHYVVQVLNAKLDTSLVSNGWRDDKRNKTYDNVFTVSNRCGFGTVGLNEGDEFEFSFDKNPPAEDCVVCMAFYPTPEKKNAVTVVRRAK